MDRQHHLKYRWNKKFYFDSDLSVWLKGSRALEYSLLAIITFWRQVVIKCAIRTSGLPPIKTTADRHFVRRTRKKVVSSNEPKGDSMKEIVKVREEREREQEYAIDGGREDSDTLRDLSSRDTVMSRNYYQQLWIFDIMSYHVLSSSLSQKMRVYLFIQFKVKLFYKIQLINHL